MKIFSFIGKTFGHTEEVIDATASIVVNSLQVGAIHAETQKLIAFEQREFALAEAKAESGLGLIDLKRRTAEALADQPKDVDTSRSIDEILSSL